MYIYIYESTATVRPSSEQPSLCRHADTSVCLHDTGNLNIPLPCTNCQIQNAEFHSPQMRTKNRNGKILS